MKIIYTIFLTAFCSFNLFAQPNVSDEEYDIYKKVFDSIYFGNSKSNLIKTSFLITENTVNADLVLVDLKPSKTVSDYSKEKLPNDIDGLLDNFLEVNKYSIKLANQFSDDRNYYIFVKKELEILFEKENTDKKLNKCKILFANTCISSGNMYEIFPDLYNYYDLSRIGFSSDKRTAVVFINKIGNNRSLPIFYILKKVGENWSVDENSIIFLDFKHLPNITSVY